MGTTPINVTRVVLNLLSAKGTVYGPDKNNDGKEDVVYQFPIPATPKSNKPDIPILIGNMQVIGKIDGKNATFKNVRNGREFAAGNNILGDAIIQLAVAQDAVPRNNPKRLENITVAVHGWVDGTRAHPAPAPKLPANFPTEAMAVPQFSQLASNGCGRLLNKDARWLYDNVPIGTPVRVEMDQTDVDYENRANSDTQDVKLDLHPYKYKDNVYQYGLDLAGGVIDTPKNREFMARDFIKSKLISSVSSTKIDLNNYQTLIGREIWQRFNGQYEVKWLNDDKEVAEFTKNAEEKRKNAPSGAPPKGYIVLSKKDVEGMIRARDMVNPKNADGSPKRPDQLTDKDYFYSIKTKDGDIGDIVLTTQ